jgi:hypothetical protein
MQNRFNFTVQAILANEAKELILVEVIGDLAVDQIVELLGTRQVVHGKNPSLSALIERLDQISTDKAGCAGDNNHASLRKGFPSRPPRQREFTLSLESAASVARVMLVPGFSIGV